MILLLWLGLARAADDPASLSERVVSTDVLDAIGRAEALRRRADVAGAWTDPMVSLEVSNAELPDLALAGNMMGGVQLRMQQTLPAPGLTSARVAAAETRAAEAETSVDEALLGLRVEVERAYWRLALARQLRALLEENVSRADDLVGAVRARYEVGGSGQGELLRLQVLRDRLADELGDLDRAEAELLAAIAGALADPSLAVDTPAALEPRPVDGDVAAWLAAAEAGRPLLELLEERAQAGIAAAKLARVEARPSPTVWAGYRVRLAGDAFAGTDLVSVGLSSPVPVASARRARGLSDAALAEASAASAAGEQARHQIRAGLEAAAAAWTRAADKARVYGDELRPQAVAALQTTLNDYQVGKADFASLYQAWTALLDLDRARLGAVVDTHLQALEVRRLVGGP